MNSNDIIKDISFLYELSLSVGQSLDKKENCRCFLHTLMSRKNLEFGGVWIRSYNIPYSENQSGYKLIYAHPHIKLGKDEISDSEFLDTCFDQNTSFSTKLTTEICKTIDLNVKEGGSITFFKLQELGFLVLYSSSSERIWNKIEQTKLKNVLEKFTISLKGCLFHEKSIQDLITISKTQKELEKAKRKAEESNELKSAFLSNISHEIRTPINAIIGFSNLLSDKDIEYRQYAGFIDHISRNSKKLLRLINNLIDVSKMDSNQLSLEEEEFKINQIIRDIYSKYQDFSHENKELKFKLNLPENTENLKIKADKNKITQVFENLIENAIKFTTKGSIEVGYSLDEHDMPIFYIRDTGIGISKEKYSAIFDIFRQGENGTTRKFEGSGIGLTLCKKLVELMDGEIWFDSKENIGTNFYFRISGSGRTKLELINENTFHEVHNSKSEDIRAIEYSKRNVLIAEDVKSNFNYLNAIIELTDANVIWAKNGKDAIEICERNQPGIDLVLMDIRMPEIGGLEAIKQIKMLNKDIPVVVQTAFTMNNEKEECFKAGADDFITKPIDPQKLIEILQRYL